MSSKETNRAFIRGRQVKLDAERLLLVEKTKAQLKGVCEVGWKNRVGKVNYKTASAGLRGSTLLFDVYKEGAKAYSVAVPLEGSDVVSERDSVILLRTMEGINYMWIRFEDHGMVREWLTVLSLAAKPMVSLEDFHIVQAVGKGGMGKVFLAKHKRTGERLALKVVDKRSVFDREGHLKHMVDERLLLEMGSDHPFVLKLRYAFQTESNFFLATEFCEGGDLYHLLKRRRKTLNEDAAKLISSEVILALESMHKKGCVYRDLKPDNVLLDSEGHVRLADFGLAKLLQGEPNRYERTNSFCGTAQYTPPEMVQKKYYTQSVDLWCLGVFMYEVLEGSTPFYNRERDRMYRRIERDTVKFSSRFSEEARDLVSNLLEKNPKYRFTLEQVKKHKFYEGIDWEKVKRKEYWDCGIYTPKEKKEVAMGELRIINTERYKNLSVEEADEVRGLLGLKIGVKKQPTLVVPGFSYTSPEIVEQERKNKDASSGNSSSTAEDTARRIMEQATQSRRKESIRHRAFRPRSVRSMRGGGGGTGGSGGDWEPSNAGSSSNSNSGLMSGMMSGMMGGYSGSTGDARAHSVSRRSSGFSRRLRSLRGGSMRQTSQKKSSGRPARATKHGSLRRGRNPVVI